jgi:hypothetical protein
VDEPLNLFIHVSSLSHVYFSGEVVQYMSTADDVLLYNIRGSILYYVLYIMAWVGAGLSCGDMSVNRMFVRLLTSANTSQSLYVCVYVFES